MFSSIILRLAIGVLSSWDAPLKKSYFNFSNFKISLFLNSKSSIVLNKVEYKSLICCFNSPTSSLELTFKRVFLSSFIILSVTIFISCKLFFINFA